MSTTAPKNRIELNIEPWPRQAEMIETDATEVMFGGASEGGKSVAIKLASVLWCLWIKNLQVLILRKYYNDVIENHMQGECNFHILLAELKERKLVKITENEVNFLSNGSRIRLAQCRTEEDFEKAQGIGKHVLIWDEATQIKPRYINDIRGWVRMSNEMKATLPVEIRNSFPRIIYTCNPIGESVSFFRREFIKARLPFAKEPVGAFIRQFIPSLISDNPSADPIAQRKRLMMMHSPQVAEALITGSWDTPAGDFFAEYDDELHVVDDWKPPAHLFKFRTFDWGSADPAVCLWWALADSETMIGDRHIPRGALICYREWYIADDKGKGIHMRNEDMAAGIVQRTAEAMSGLTFSDSFPFADRGHSKNGNRWTMADTFMDSGCPLTLGNTARVYGWKQMRARLQGIAGVPMLYICRSCKNVRDYIPALPYHETKSEDAAESGESTHACDAVRLACSARPFVIEAPPQKQVRDPRMSATPTELLKQLKKKSAQLGRR